MWDCFVFIDQLPVDKWGCPEWASEAVSCPFSVLAAHKCLPVAALRMLRAVNDERRVHNGRFCEEPKDGAVLACVLTTSVPVPTKLACRAHYVSRCSITELAGSNCNQPSCHKPYSSPQSCKVPCSYLQRLVSCCDSHGTLCQPHALRSTHLLLFQLQTHTPGWFTRLFQSGHTLSPLFQVLLSALQISMCPC